MVKIYKTHNEKRKMTIENFGGCYSLNVRGSLPFPKNSYLEGLVLSC